jgi:predicted double-glycine peptidase
MTKRDKKPYALEDGQVTLLDFPDVRQSNGFTCGCDSLLAVLYYYGLSYREDKLAKLIKTDEEGTDPQPMAALCRKLGFKVDIGKMNIKKLKDYVNRGVPVIVAYQAWRDKTSPWKSDYIDGHYSVVIGYDQNNFILEDPSMLNKGYIPNEEFLERWHDIDKHGHKYQNLGIAIYGKKPKYDSLLIKKIE